jgi:hypothetical protein
MTDRKTYLTRLTRGTHHVESPSQTMQMMEAIA